MWDGMIHACREPRKQAFLAAERVLLNTVEVVCCKEGMPGRVEKLQLDLRSGLAWSLSTLLMGVAWPGLQKGQGWVGPGHGIVGNVSLWPPGGSSHMESRALTETSQPGGCGQRLRELLRS